LIGNARDIRLLGSQESRSWKGVR